MFSYSLSTPLHLLSMLRLPFPSHLPLRPCLMHCCCGLAYARSESAAEAVADR